MPELKLLPNRQPRLNVTGAAPPMDNNPGPANPSANIPQRPPPNDFALVETIPKRISLPMGTSAIPFQIYVPNNQVPSFSYTSIRGPAVFNKYVITRNCLAKFLQTPYLSNRCCILATLLMVWSVYRVIRRGLVVCPSWFLHWAHQTGASARRTGTTT